MSFSAAQPSAVSPKPNTASCEEETVKEWRVHRLRDNPQLVPLVALAYAVAFALWRLLFPHPLALFLPIFALTGALAEFLFPVTYKLTTKGAHKKCWTTQLFIAWDDVKRAGQGQDGVFLSPLSRPSRLDDFRGVRLRFGGENPDEICQTVRDLWHRRAAPMANESENPTL